MCNLFAYYHSAESRSGTPHDAVHTGWVTDSVVFRVTFLLMPAASSPVHAWWTSENVYHLPPIAFPPPCCQSSILYPAPFRFYFRNPALPLTIILTGCSEDFTRGPLFRHHGWITVPVTVSRAMTGISPYDKPDIYGSVWRPYRRNQNSELPSYVTNYVT